MLSISHSPNSTFKQQVLALSLLFQPWKWSRGGAAAKLEQEFTTALGLKDAISFVNGREALYAVLSALGIGQGHEVILQAYTCIVVPNTIIWAGAKPIYADIDSSLNISV